MEAENSYCSLRKPTEDVYTTTVQLQDRGASGGPTGASEHSENSKKKVCLLKFLFFLCGSILASIVLLAIYNLIPFKDKGAVDEMKQNYSINEQQLMQLRMQCDSLNREHSNLSEYQKALQMNLSSLQSLYFNLSANHTKLLSYYSALTQENAEFSAIIEKLNKQCPISNSSSQSRTRYVCPQSWMLFNSKCYLFSSNMLTWAEGLDGCRQNGAHLVIIESEQEQAFLLNELSKQSPQKPYWIALNDIATEGQFFWVDNKRLDPSKSFWGVNWDGSKEPDNWRNQEDCVQIQKTTTCSGWYDVRCSDINNVICEREAEGIAL